jgi:hypothetical protein
MQRCALSLASRREASPSKRVRGNVQPIVVTLTAEKTRTFKLINPARDRLAF